MVTFTFARLVKPRPSTTAKAVDNAPFARDATRPEADGVLRECPICFVAKADVEPLPHLDATAGDVASHCMCGECRAAFKSFACPFCRGKIGGSFVATAAIRQFVDKLVGTMCHDARHGDQHKHAVWLERWEAFEFEHGNFISDTGHKHHAGRPDVVAQVAAMVVQERRFAPLLESGIERARKARDGNTWLCNGSGIIFRLHGLLQSGSLAVSPELGGLLRRANEAIFEALARPGWHGAMLGCLYMQAISAWLSACRCGDGETTADAQTVRRAGLAVSKLCEADGGRAAETKKHTVESFVRLASKQVWEGRDPLLKVAYGVAFDK